jgi:hypothetical protein
MGSEFQTSLAVFAKHEVFAMPEAHEFKHREDFLLSLIRNAASSEKVNNITVECGCCL